MGAKRIFYPQSFLIRVGAGLAMVFAMSYASAALFEDEDARRAILDLRKQVQQQAIAAQQIDAFNKQRIEALEAALVESGQQNVQLRRLLVDLQNQIDSLQGDLARLRGSIEPLQRDVAEVKRNQKDVKDLGGSLDPKLQSLDQRLSRLEPVRVVLEGQEVLVDQEEKREFDAAMNVFRLGDYVKTQKQLTDFLTQRPRSAYVPSALFWLASAQYAQRDYKEAIGNFRSLLARAPNHVKAPEALLGIANSQLESKDVRAGKKSLEDLVRQYPGTEAAAIADSKLRSLR
jgi:tol-pal system protein YbgF